MINALQGFSMVIVYLMIEIKIMHEKGLLDRHE